jgi:hypothetical protein
MLENATTPVGKAAKKLVDQVADTEPRQDDADKVLSYKSVRVSVGVVGFALPIVLLVSVIWVEPMPGSISAFYYTPMRNYFVGTLFAMGIFLFSYRYAPRDNILSGVAALLVAFVALSPTAQSGQPHTAWNVAHLVAAGTFFAVLAGFSYFLFTRTEDGVPPEPGTHKARRNKIYRACGVITLLALVIGAALLQSPIHLLFWWETVAVWAFSFSWLVKGGLLFADPPANADEARRVPRPRRARGARIASRNGGR